MATANQWRTYGVCVLRELRRRALCIDYGAAGTESADSLPREVMFIVDESGSMAGDSMTQARAALSKGVDSLSGMDTFNVLAFDDQIRPLFEHPKPAAGENLAELTISYRMFGPTVAPRCSPPFFPGPLTPKGQSGAVLTDGAIGNEQALLNLIHRRLDDRRLFLIAIGSAPNAGFMREASRFGRGAFTAISRTDEVETKMADLIDKLESPVLTQIEVAPGSDIYPK